MFKFKANDAIAAQVTNHGILKYPFALNLYVPCHCIAFHGIHPNTFHSYDVPPLYDVTIEEFETSALDRLRILAEIESSAVRNRPWDELKKITTTQCDKYLPLHSTVDKGCPLDAERKRDQLSHFVLRLAFCRS